MNVPHLRPRRPGAVAVAGLLLGMVGGWVAGLLRVSPRPPAGRP